ncbi:MAG: hypothetical protein WC872_02395 [Candidatus Absconditabacterales bacterium]
MADIEKIKSNVDEIKKSVSDLKSEIETFDKEKNTLQKNIIDQKQQEIDNKKNEIEKKKKETQDLIEKARNEYINLKLDDLDEATKKTVQEEKTKNEALLNEYEKELKAIETDKKSFWEKVKDGGNKVVNYVKANPGKSLLLATGIGALLYFIFRKKKKNKEDGDGKENDSDSKGSKVWKWIKNGLLIAGTATGLYYLYNYLKPNDLNFKDAMTQVKAELNNIKESEINKDRGELKYDETSKEIKSYNTGTKINKGWRPLGKKSIEGLDIKFSDNKQLIHAANLVNYLKHEFGGRCTEDEPFDAGWRTGDYYVKINGGEKEVISGGIFSTIAKICPTLNNGLLSDTNNKQKFLAYINGLGCRAQGNNYPQPPTNGEKPREAANKIINEIINTPDPNFKGGGNNARKAINAEKIKDNEYNVKSRDKETKINLTMNTTDPTKIDSTKVEGLDITFTDLKEAVRTANLINKLKREYRGKCGSNNAPFSYRGKIDALGHSRSGLYVNNERLPDRAVKKESLQKRTPTLYANIDPLFVDYLNGLKDSKGESLRTKYGT